MVGPGQRGDARQTTELEVATVEFDEGVSRGDEAGPRRTRDRRRGPRLLLPVLVFAALLATGLVIGRYVIPAGGAEGGPEKAQPGAPGVGAETPSPTLPSLPTPPTRPADALAAWAYKISQVIAVPVVAAQAYGYAQLELQRTDSACHLSWTTLAGIGEIGSRHGQAGGAVLEQGGRSSPAIVGPLLDGKAGRAVVRDTDAGAFDGDATFDRAMGPLRLMPALWRALLSTPTATESSIRTTSTTPVWRWPACYAPDPRISRSWPAGWQRSIATTTERLLPLGLPSRG